MYVVGVQFVTDVQYRWIFWVGTLSFTLHQESKVKSRGSKAQQYLWTLFEFNA